MTLNSQELVSTHLNMAIGFMVSKPLLLFLLSWVFQASALKNESHPGEECHNPGIPTDSCIEYKFINSKFEINATWIFRCTWGFPRHGLREIVCNPGGQWSEKIPNCVRETGISNEKYCQHPERHPDHWYEEGWVFSMKSGYNVTCGPDGKWHGSIPSCMGSYFESTNNDSKGNLCPNIFGEGKCSEIGTVVDLGKCGEADEKLTCGKNGHWNGKIPICEGQHFHWSLLPYTAYYNHRLDGQDTASSSATMPTSPIGRFPWYVAIAIKMDNGWFINCSGALLSDKWVLTSAQCLTNQENGATVPNAKDSIVLYLGKYYRNNSKDDDHVMRMNISKVIPHPKFDPKSLLANIALIELEDSVVWEEFGDRVRPICLPQLGTISPMSPLQSEQPAVVIGWGKNAEHQPIDEQQHLLMKYANLDECQLESSESTDSMFCAQPFSQNDILKTAFGESGGPLIFEEFHDGYSRFVIEGVISSGYGTNGTYKMLFTKVRPYFCWIKETIHNGQLMSDSRDPKVRITCGYQRYGSETQEDYAVNA